MANNKVTEAEFNGIKELQELGLTQGQVQAIAKRSSATTSYIFRCDSYEEYKLLIATVYKNNYAPQEEQVEQAITQIPVRYESSVESTLESINNKLDLVLAGR